MSGRAGLMLLCIINCSSVVAEDISKSKHTYFVQLPFNMTLISKIQKSIGPIIDKIIEEESGLQPNRDIPLFFFKKRAAITVYYVNDMYVNGEQFLFSSLDAMQNIGAPADVFITSKVDFFGEQKDDRLALTDLVVKVEDSKGELLLLNKEAKKVAHKANERYHDIYHTNLYDVNKSEKYPYLPHLSLGHLRPNYIKYLLNDESRAEKVIERIKERITQAVANALSGLPLESRKLRFNKLSIYDLQKRIYVKEIKLLNQCLSAYPNLIGFLSKNYWQLNNQELLVD